VIELSQSELLDVCGKNDQRIRELESEFDIRIVPRGNTLKLIGPADNVSRARNAIRNLLSISRGKPGPAPITNQQFRYTVESIKSDKEDDVKAVFSDRSQLHLRKRSVSAMTAGQKRYLDSIRRSDIVFGIGPAGTGKTYLAMASAVHYLMNNYVRRIVLVRPAVEAGEKLGFLPGDIAAKFDPFVRPLYDALNDMMDPEKARMLLDNGTIEIAPLAFMRGRTLNSSFVILDEGQNTSIEQMKMFLTRLGYDSKAVITGDITQIDLPSGKESGLVQVRRVLSDIRGIEFVMFDERDVVRHELVQKIIRAYERYDHGNGSGQQELELDAPVTGEQVEIESVDVSDAHPDLPGKELSA
jgi:phosphate starvation-inducible protein PhoH and related proteins